MYIKWWVRERNAYRSILFEIVLVTGIRFVSCPSGIGHFRSTCVYAINTELHGSPRQDIPFLY